MDARRSRCPSCSRWKTRPGPPSTEERSLGWRGCRSIEKPQRQGGRHCGECQNTDHQQNGRDLSHKEPGSQLPHSLQTLCFQDSFLISSSVAALRPSAVSALAIVQKLLAERGRAIRAAIDLDPDALDALLDPFQGQHRRAGRKGSDGLDRAARFIADDLKRHFPSPRTKQGPASGAALTSLSLEEGSQPLQCLNKRSRGLVP